MTTNLKEGSLNLHLLDALYLKSVSVLEFSKLSTYQLNIFYKYDY